MREGYKKTEVGVIPEDWEVKKLEDICEFLDGRRKPIKAFDRENMKGDIPYYGASGIIDWVNDYIFDEDIILLGEDGENIKSRNVPLAFKVTGKCWVNNHAHVLKPKKDNIDFVTEILESKDYTPYVIGSAQPKLTQADCRKIKIQVPPLKEQEKIAEILSTVDSQIDDTEKLIEKSKELKKGLMQKLLTKGIGHSEFKKTEVGEIPVSWEVKKLKDLVEIVNGGTPDTNNDSYWNNGNIKWATPTDITKNMSKYINKTEKLITENGLKNSSARILPVGSILMSSRATIGERAINTVPMCTNQGFKSLICTDKINNEYLYYYIHLLRSKMIRLASGSTFLEISKKEVENMRVSVPSLDEQIKIGEILSCIDNNIENYETKKQKLEEVKKGLMQQLLTGKIRVTI